MKKIFLTFAIIFALTIDLVTQSGWYGQYPKPSGSRLSSIFYVDNNTVWAVGGSGYLLKSIDGGISWESKLLNPNYVLSGIQFVDQLSGIVYGVEIEYEPGFPVNQYSN